MPFDLEAELLRAAWDMCSTDAFTHEALASFIVDASATRGAYCRLAHPLVSHLLGSLLESLVAQDCLERIDDRYCVTDTARTYLQRAPQYLG
jgi:hypothetical protein